MILETLLGRKGEIYPPKRIREMLDIKPGDKLIMEVRGRELVIRKAPSLEDLLMREPKHKISLEEDLKLRREISGRLME